MIRRNTPITLVVPDASPLLSLGRVDRLDIFSAFVVPIHIVDVVAEEAVRPQNDVNSAVRAWLDKRPNNVSIVETNVGLGLKHRRERARLLKRVILGRLLLTNMRRFSPDREAAGSFRWFFSKTPICWNSGSRDCPMCI